MCKTASGALGHLSISLSLSSSLPSDAPPFFDVSSTLEILASHLFKKGPEWEEKYRHITSAVKVFPDMEELPGPVS